ncbi:hypothetical protein K8I85_06625 [bacterium]|nr:hypothetical protein [bacterium]
MMRRKRPRTSRLVMGGVLCGILAIAGPAHSLERRSVRADRGQRDGWDAGASCSITYANICSGWLYVWTGEEDDVWGVVFDPCCASGQLISTQAYFWTGAPAGWGCTGTLAVSEVIDDCLGATYDARPLIPPGRGGPVQTDDWLGVLPGSVALTYTFGYVSHLPITPNIPSDHPAAGPTGPQACGYCYPSTRVTHFLSFGTTTAPLCPGSPFNDGVCDAEALFWSAGFTCAVSTQPSTWGAIKVLYR